MKPPENPFNRKDHKLMKNPSYKSMTSPYESKYPQPAKNTKKSISRPKGKTK